MPDAKPDPKEIQRARYEFKRDLEELDASRGRGTELVSVYIAPGRQIADVTNQLRAELGQASNIKSKTTMKNVTSALETIIGRLKGYRETPPNGLVLLAGEVVTGNNQTRMLAKTIVPPEPVPINTYRCDSSFFLEPLEAMLEHKQNYGLLVVDRQEATIGVLRGQRIEVIRNMQSHVPRKHRKGGQSQRRMERNIEIEADAFFRKVAEDASAVFQSVKDLQGVLVGGPGSTKNEVADSPAWHYEIKKKIVQTFDTGYTDEFGLKELVDNAHSKLAELGLTREKDIVGRFLGELRKPQSVGAYGEAEVRHMLQLGAVEILLLSEALRKWRVPMQCSQGHPQEAVTTGDMEKLRADPGVCATCNNKRMLAEPVDLVKELSDLAGQTNSDVEIITRESPEGDMFWTAFGGIAAILRYRPA